MELNQKFKEFNIEDPFFDTAESDSENLRDLWLNAHFSEDDENDSDNVLSDSEE